MTVSRERYLAEIGIPVWKLRAPASEPAATAAGLARAAVATVAPPLERSVAPARPVAAPRAVEPLAVTSAAVVRQPRTPEGEEAVWRQLATEVRGCILCGLHKTRTQTVFGVGRRDADLLVIGEAPGADEDRQGEPFVGRAGQLLNAMLHAINLPRSEVYIANILKCRPPGNRDPQPDEAAQCTPYLARQLALVRPKVLLAVGRIAAQWLLQSDAPIGRLRGRVHQYGDSGTPLIVTYHPAYLLRSPLSKATAWTDLCMVKDLLSRER